MLALRFFEVRNYFRSSPRKRGPSAKAAGVTAIFPGLDSRLRGNERSEVRNYFLSSPRKRGPSAKAEGVTAIFPGLDSRLRGNERSMLTPPARAD
jgi:hypothetical protein